VQPEFREDIRVIIPTIVEHLEHFNDDVCKAAIELLLGLGMQAEFCEDVRIMIPTIAECLKHSDFHVRVAAIEHLSRLVEQCIC